MEKSIVHNAIIELLIAHSKASFTRTLSVAVFVSSTFDLFNVTPENLLFGKIFAENCMKMREIGLSGRTSSLAPPFGSANVLEINSGQIVLIKVSPPPPGIQLVQYEFVIDYIHSKTSPSLQPRNLVAVI